MSGAITTMDRRVGRGISIRLMYGPHHRGTLLKHTDGRWGIYSVDEKRLTKMTYLQPVMARDMFDQLFPNGVSQA